MAVDTPYLGAYLSIAEPSLQSLLSSPTADLVQSLLRQVSLKAKEHEQTHADRLKLEVELENAVRTSESKARAQKASVDKSLAEVATLRKKLHEEETSRVKVEGDLQSLKGSVSASDHDASALKARVASLENSNRDTLQLLQSKTGAYDDVSNELVSKQQKINELRAEVSRLEQVAQDANSASTAAKLREQTLKQETEMLRRNNDWLETELKTKSAEYNRFRKEKNSQVAELQRQNEEITMQLESQERTGASLQSRIDETTQKIDQLLVQIKDLREEADRNDQNYRAELDTAKRLEKLMEESLNTEKARRQELSAQLEQLRDDAAEEVGRITAEVETEHQERLNAEDRVAELESRLEQLQSQDAVAPATPRNGGSGSRRGTPVPDGTPSKRNVSLTQMVSDYHSIKTELDTERRRSSELRRTMDEMLQDIEARQPEIAEMQADHARMEKDLLEMSHYAERVAKECEEAKQSARMWERERGGLAREGDILRQQLRDVSSQVKILLMEVNTQMAGFAPFTAEQRAQLESLAHGDLDSDMADNVTDTSRFISEHLTTFRNIAELTDQNSKLLRLTRELGEKMEGDEAQAQRSQATQNLEELEELKQKYARCKDEMSSLATQSQSYIKERDMFRRMLSHRGQLPAMSDVGSMFDQSVNGQVPATPPPNFAASQRRSPNSKDVEDYRKLLKEMQSHFDSYRQESASDRNQLKQQADDATQKSSELRNQLSKKVGELTLANERYEMLQGNFKMLKAENAELQRRSSTMSEKASKQDLRAQRVAEELIEAKGVIESIRNESANLKAEKEFWKSVESRLTNDVSSLQTDRERLNVLNVNLQNLLNEREHADSESRRRLEAQAENLESEVKSLKRRLNEEQEDNKRLALRREHETTQTQTRTEELNSTLATTREELIAAKTARDHLQTRVDELVIELRSAVEKVDVLQQRPSTATGAGQTQQPADGSMSREQELAMEVSELKKNLDLVQTELTSARQQIEQYKAISTSSEEELRSFNDSHEQYRQEMDNLIEEKENRLKLLEQDLENLRAELAARNTELNEVRTESAQSDHKLAEQKATFEAEVTKLKDLQERAESAAHYHQQDLKSQAEIAQQAQQNYENELLKHAEAAKTLQKIRNDYHELKIKNMEIAASAETAEAKLSQNEESWSEARDRYERELGEMRSRKDDIGAQNKILHEQLENLNKQISSFQRSSSNAADTVGEDTSTSANADIANLQELIRYLRREKDIVDVQYDLATQEARRLHQQLNHTQSQLEETRLKLSQQRSAEETTELHALNHKKLMDTIEELNLNRESSSTLRAEKQQLQSSLNEKSSQIEELQNQLTPLQAKISELEDQNEVLTQDLRMTGEARARFEQRYLDLLNRSNSVDPAEFEKIQQQLSAVQEERDTLKTSAVDLQSQVDALPEKIKESVDEANRGFQEIRQKIIEQSKTRDRTQGARIKEKDAALQEAVQEKAKLDAQLAELQAQLENAQKEHDETVKRLQDEAQNTLQAENASQAASGGEGAGTSSADDNSSHIQELNSKIQAAEAQAAAANAKLQELESREATAQRKLEEAQSTIQTLQSEQQEASQREIANADGGVSDPITTVDQLRRELVETQQELEAKAAELLSKEGAASIQNTEEVSVEDQIKSRVDAIHAELQRRHDERVGKAEEFYKTRLENMRQLLTKKLSEGKADISRKLEAAQATAISNLKADYEKQLQDLAERHQEEVEELRRLTVAPASDNPTERTNVVKDDASVQTENFLLQLKDSEIKSLLQEHEVARRLVINNITKREAKAKETEANVWTAKLAEAEAKARKDQEQAVTMEGKKFSVKLNMAENRAKNAAAKVDMVQQAANDTPEKSVGEVWAIAKNAKPAPAAPTTSALQQSIHASPATPKAQPNSSAPGPQTGGASTTATPSTKQPVLTQPAAAPVTPNTASSNVAAVQAANGTASGAKQHASTPAKAALSQSVHAAQAPGGEGQAVPSGNADETADAKPKALDQPLSDPKAGQTAPARPAQQSAIPVPGGRGSGIPQPGGQRGGAAAGRGRGRGGAASGRGGASGVNTAAAQGSAQGSAQAGQQIPSPRTMNPSAKQFVPKNRKRDADGAGLEGSVHAGETKRAKPES